MGELAGVERVERSGEWDLMGERSKTGLAESRRGDLLGDLRGDVCGDGDRDVVGESPKE